MSQPIFSSAYNDPLLQTVAVAFLQEPSAFVADQVFPIVPVQLPSGQYPIFDQAEFFRDDATELADGDMSAGGSYTITKGDFSATRYAWHKDVTALDRATWRIVGSAEGWATRYCVDKIRLKRETKFVENFFKTSVWTGASDTTPSNLWDTANGDPVGDVNAMQDEIEEKTGKRPNTLVVAPKVLTALRNNADIKERVKYSQLAMINDDSNGRNLIAQALGVGNLLVPKCIKTTSAKGQTATYSFIYGNNAMLCYVNPSRSADPMNGSAGYTFMYVGEANEGADMQTGIRMKSWLREGGDPTRIQADTYYSQKLAASNLGGFFSAVIS